MKKLLSLLFVLLMLACAACGGRVSASSAGPAADAKADPTAEPTPTLEPTPTPEPTPEPYSVLAFPFAAADPAESRTLKLTLASDDPETDSSGYLKGFMSIVDQDGVNRYLLLCFDILDGTIEKKSELDQNKKRLIVTDENGASYEQTGSVLNKEDSDNSAYAHIALIYVIPEGVDITKFVLSDSEHPEISAPIAEILG